MRKIPNKSELSYSGLIVGDLVYAYDPEDDAIANGDRGIIIELIEEVDAVQVHWTRRKEVKAESCENLYCPRLN